MTAEPAHPALTQRNHPLRWRPRSVLVPALMLAVLATLSSAQGDSRAEAPLARRAPHGDSPIRSLTGFVENAGQWPSDVLFFARQGPIEATLRKDALVLRPQHDPESDEPRPAPLVLRMPGEGAVELVGEDLLPTKHHFLLGDLSKHVSDVRGYARVTYRDVAPGIDLLVRSETSGFAYDLLLEPGADLAELQLGIEGASAPRLRDDGVLVLDTGSGPVEQHIGAAWEVDEVGRRIDVASAFRLLGTGTSGELQLGFEAPTRRSDRAFVLDPSVIFSTYVGGTSQEKLGAMDVAPDGSTYLIAQTGGAMPVSRTADDPTENGGAEAWVGKLSADGQTLEWGTYLGGAATEMVGGVHRDSDGTVVAVGRTWSAEFPSTSGTVQPASGSPGLADIFITRLAADGASIVWSTFYGGPQQEGVDFSALFPNGDVLVVGLSKEGMPPATPGTYDEQWNPDDAYLLRVTANGTEVVFQSFFPRIAIEVVIGPEEHIYFAGATNATKWPDLGTPGAYQQFLTPGGSTDGIVGRLDPLATEIEWATYIGGASTDNAQDLALDKSGAVYVAGVAFSSDFPVTPGTFDTTNPNYHVTKLLPDGTDLVWSTYLTSIGAAQSIWDLTVDRAGNATVTGSTNGPDFPTTPDAFQPELNVGGPSGDATLTKLDAFGESLEYSTYFGGSNQDLRASIGFDDANLLHMVIQTESTDHFITPDAFQPTEGGGLGGDLHASAWDLDLLPWTVMSSALKGTTHTPNFAGTGELTPGAPTRLSIRGALPGAPAWFVIGLEDISLPFKGGTFVPAPTLLVPFSPDANGAHDRSFPWLDVPGGITVFMQAWIKDPGGTSGWSASNALQLISQ